MGLTAVFFQRGRAAVPWTPRGGERRSSASACGENPNGRLTEKGLGTSGDCLPVSGQEERVIPPRPRRGGWSHVGLLITSVESRRRIVRRACAIGPGKKKKKRHRRLINRRDRSPISA